MSFLCEKLPLGAPLEVYEAETLACIAIGDQNRPEGPGFFACSRPIAPKGSLVYPQITRCNHSPTPPSSVRASYSVAMRLGPVLAGPVHSCVGAAGCFAAVCCVS